MWPERHNDVLMAGGADGWRSTHRADSFRGLTGARLRHTARALWHQGGGPEDAAKEPIIMTAITTIGLNKWDRVEKKKEKKNSSYSDQIGPNEIKMPINPVLIAAHRRPRKTGTCGGEEVAGG